jgi:trigger factor
MNIEVIKIDSANAQIKAVIPNSTIDEKKDKLAKDASKNMNIDGFRKGKVPITIIKQRYGDKLNEDAKSEAVKEIYQDGIKELNIADDLLIGEPSIEEFDEQDNQINVVIALNLKPDLSIDGYKDLIPDFDTPEISNQDIDDKIKVMLKGVTKPSSVSEDRTLQKDDIALIDFEGFIGEEPFEGGNAKGYSLEIGSGSFIPGFEESMIGMSKGDKKDIEVTFPKEYGSEKLAGQDAIFKVVLHDIQEINISDDIDSDTLKKLLPREKEPSQELLKERVKEQLEQEKLTPIYQDDLKPKYVNSLLEKFDIDIPKSIVEQEIDMSTRKALSQMKEEEIKEFSKDIEAYKAKREEFRDEAIESVKITFLVDALAKAENISVDDQEVMQTIYYEAIQVGQNPQEVLKQYEEGGLLPAVKMALVEDRVFKKLFDDKRAK